jgi:hypothetical protein
MSLRTVIFEDNWLNILDASVRDYSTIDILDKAEGYYKPYIKSVKEEKLLILQKCYNFPIIKWCGYPRTDCYNFAMLANNLYSKGFMTENQWQHITKDKCVNFYNKIEWAGKIYIDREPRKQTAGWVTNVKSYFDIKCLIFTKEALYKLHEPKYSPILKSLEKANTVIYTLKKYIDELWKYPKKFYIKIEQPSILSSQIDSLILMNELKNKYLATAK